jgi:hypothetical protein
LSARNANARKFGSDPPNKLIYESGFPNAGLTRNEDNLVLLRQAPLQTMA